MSVTAVQNIIGVNGTNLFVQDTGEDDRPSSSRCTRCSLTAGCLTVSSTRRRGGCGWCAPTSVARAEAISTTSR